MNIGFPRDKVGSSESTPSGLENAVRPPYVYIRVCRARGPNVFPPSKLIVFRRTACLTLLV